MNMDELRSRMSPDIAHLSDRVMRMYEAPFARQLGIEIVRIERDRTECSMELRPEHMNSMGRDHGAAIYGLIDHTFAIACNLEHDSTGQSCEVKYYRPAKGKLTAVATPINRSRSIEVFSIDVFSEERKLIASSTCTGFILRCD